MNRQITLVARDGGETTSLLNAAWVWIADLSLNLTVRHGPQGELWLEDLPRAEGDPHPDDATLDLWDPMV